ncbi:hypothetical protein TRAPUB_3540 [Trametes pubescens]|uniref:F-box domain-containing protein n=1 Tax=Trametes pubescens TaxID=154538 RepID=A0A1M2VDK1_TRAPU|nr:hypothetical protein TRAPUB_3540 [Trametes pubescens]
MADPWRFPPGATIIDTEPDSVGPLVVGFGLASLHAVGLALARLTQRPPQNKPWLPDDILYEVFSHLDPADAAQAGLVCAQWHRNAAQASYREVSLHTSSPFSRSLARTLMNNPRLRRYVRHLTVVHCAPLPQEHLYEWIYLLPPFSLKTFRVFALPEPTEKLRSAIVVGTAPITEIALFGYQYSKEVLLNSISSADNPARRQWLIRMLGEGWQLDQLKPYRTHLQAVSAELAYPVALQRFSEVIGVIAESPATFHVEVTVTDARGVSRERIDALVEAAGKYIPATSCITVNLVHQHLPTGEASASEDEPSEPSGQAPQFVREDELVENMHQLAPSRCMCTSPPADQAIPSSAFMRVFVGFTSELLTDETVKRVVDWIWQDTMPDGRPLNVASFRVAHYGRHRFPEPSFNMSFRGVYTESYQYLHSPFVE